MKKHKWSFEQIRQINNRDFILRILDERAKVLEPGSPLRAKCKKARRWLYKLTNNGELTPKQAFDAILKPEKVGKHRKPDIIKHSHHKTRVHLTQLQKAEMRSMYYAEEDGHKKYKIEDIQKHFNISPGEIYRILHKKDEPLNRRVGRLVNVS